MLRISPPDEALLESVVAVVVSNNPYEFAPLSALGERYHLNTGTLQATVLSAATLGELDWTLAGVLLGTIEQHRRLRYRTSDSLEIAVSGGPVRAGIDGELVTLEAPLRFSVAPAALRVLVPYGVPANRRAPPLESAWHAARTLSRWLRPPSNL